MFKMEYEKTTIGNRTVMKDQANWDKKIAELRRYKDKILFRIDTWKKYDWVVLENDDEIRELNKHPEISGVFGDI